MKVYAVEECGTQLGVPNASPDGRWRVLRVFKTRKKAQDHINSIDIGLCREFSHFRVHPMEVK